MDFWLTEREALQRRICEIEVEIAAQQCSLENHNADLPLQLIAVMKDCLARTKIHAGYIENRIEANGAANKLRARNIQVFRPSIPPGPDR